MLDFEHWEHDSEHLQGNEVKAMTDPTVVFQYTWAVWHCKLQRSAQDTGNLFWKIFFFFFLVNEKQRVIDDYNMLKILPV